MRTVFVVAIALITSNIFASDRIPFRSCEILFVRDGDLRGVIKSDNVELTPLEPSHLRRLKKLYSEKDIKRFFLGQYLAIGKASEHIKWSMAPNFGRREAFCGRWAILFEGHFAGVFELVRIDPEKVHIKAEPNAIYLNVGYALAPHFRGRGIATRALTMAIDFATSVVKADFIYASTNIRNTPSQALLVKNGFARIEENNHERMRFLLDLKIMR